jgi:plastocyanin
MTKRLLLGLAFVPFVSSCGPDAPVDLSIGQALAPLEVTVTDNEYTPKEIEIRAGQTISFENLGANPHDIVLADPESLPDFGTDVDAFGKGSVYETAIDKPGQYAFYCSIHGTKKGSGMAGIIIVR